MKIILTLGLTGDLAGCKVITSWTDGNPEQGDDAMKKVMAKDVFVTEKGWGKDVVEMTKTKDNYTAIKIDSWTFGDSRERLTYVPIWQCVNSYAQRGYTAV